MGFGSGIFPWEAQGRGLCSGEWRSTEQAEQQGQVCRRSPEVRWLQKLRERPRKAGIQPWTPSHGHGIAWHVALLSPTSPQDRCPTWNGSDGSEGRHPAPKRGGQPLPGVPAPPSPDWHPPVAQRAMKVWACFFTSSTLSAGSGSRCRMCARKSLAITDTRSHFSFSSTSSSQCCGDREDRTLWGRSGGSRDGMGWGREKGKGRGKRGRGRKGRGCSEPGAELGGGSNKCGFFFPGISPGRSSLCWDSPGRENQSREQQEHSQCQEDRLMSRLPEQSSSG